MQTPVLETIHESVDEMCHKQVKNLLLDIRSFHVYIYHLSQQRSRVLSRISSQVNQP